jgi:hypothetical protein
MNSVEQDSSVGIASNPLQAGRSGDRILVSARFSVPVQTGPVTHPASYTVCTGSFPGVMQTGRGVHHQPPSSAEVGTKVELYHYSPSGLSWPVIGWTLHHMDFTLYIIWALHFTSYGLYTLHHKDFTLYIIWTLHFTSYGLYTLHHMDFFLTMTDTITSENIDLSSWITLCVYVTNTHT